MANEYLLPVYKKLFGEDFNYYEFKHRMKMQKAIYLLQEMGVPVGGYSYRWYLHGPYSQVLQDDMFEERGNPTKELVVSEESLELIEKLGEVFHSKKQERYEEDEWVECLGSMLYLERRVLPADADQDAVVTRLMAEKEHLKYEAANKVAYELLKELFAV